MERGSRLPELQRYAAGHDDREHLRGAVVRALAEHLDPDEVFLAMGATIPGAAAAIVLVTSRRVHVAYQATVAASVSVTVLERSDLSSSRTTPNGHLQLTTPAGSVEVGPFDPARLEHLDLAISLPRPETTPRRARLWARPITDLQLIAALLESGVLTGDEHDTLRSKLLLRMAARAEAE